MMLIQTVNRHKSALAEFDAIAREYPAWAEAVDDVGIGARDLLDPLVLDVLRQAPTRAAAQVVSRLFDAGRQLSADAVKRSDNSVQAVIAADAFAESSHAAVDYRLAM